MRIRVSDLKRIIREAAETAYMPGRRESKGGTRMKMASIIGPVGGPELDAALDLVMSDWREQWPDADVELVMDKLYDTIQDAFDDAMRDLESPGYSLIDQPERDPRFDPADIYMELSNQGMNEVDPHQAYIELSDNKRRKVTIEDFAMAVGLDPKDIDWNGTGLRLMPDGTVDDMT